MGTIGLVLTVPIAAAIAGILTKYRKVELTEIHEDAPTAEELQELLQIDKPSGKGRFAVSGAMIVVLVGTVLIYHRLNNISATITEQRDEDGNVVSKSEYAKGRVLSPA